MRIIIIMLNKIYLALKGTYQDAKYVVLNSPPIKSV
jgi:hypothetical protein